MRTIKRNLTAFCFILAGAYYTVGQTPHFADSIEVISQIEDLEICHRAFEHLLLNEQLKSFPDTQALVLHELAYTEEYLHLFVEACKSNLRALRIRETLMTDDVPESREVYCRSVFNLARNYLLSGNRDSALYYYSLVSLVSPVNRQKSKSACEIGRIYRDEREFSLTRSYALEALRFALMDTLDFEIQTAYVLLIDGFNAMLHDGGVLHAADSILLYTAKARSYFEDLPSPWNDDALLNSSKIRFLESNAFKKKDDFDNAIRLLIEAQDLYDQISPNSTELDKGYEAELHNSIGIVFRKLGQYTRAYESLQLALEMRKSMGDSINVAVTHNNLGDLFRDQSMYEEALNHYHESTREIVGHSKPDQIGEIPSVNEIKDHYNLADIFKFVGFEAVGWSQYYQSTRDTSHCLRALKTYELADSLVDLLRFKHLRESSKLLWRNDAKRMYANAISAALHIGDQRRALYFSDRSKAILVLDAVREHGVRNTPARELMERKDSLQEQIIALERFNNANDAWMQLTAALDQVNSELKKVIPHYAGPSNTFSLSRLTELQRSMPVDEAVIQYFSSPESQDAFDPSDTLYAFVITRTRMQGVGLNKKAILEAMRTYQEMISGFLERGISNAQAPGADPLYLLLIKPLEPLPEKITIIPDGAIAQIGFDGLRDEEGKYLIESKTLRYDLSLAMGDEMSVVTNTNEKILAFAPMTESLCGQRILPHTRTELNGIASIAKSTAFFGHSASRQKLLQLAGDYGVLHLATHASANTHEPGKSWMAFSGDTSTCDLLYVQDLYTQHIPSAMVVVSACEGAHGVYASGEGAMSVARGFAYAGAASIVTSLWQVNDAATAEIMKSFYQYLADGQTKSDALRLAKLDYIHDDKRKKMEMHPAWWSAFIVIGNDVPLQFQKPVQSSYLYFIGIGLVALVVILVYRWRRR